MRPLFRIVGLVWAAAPWAMTRGALLSVLVLVMGAALLGLSGWFITATGMAGLAGIGIAFDVFRPSAGVRLLALGRAGARYAERLLTHDATLRALAALRVDLLRRYGSLPHNAMQRLRGGLALTRITTDVDALDGVVLRLVLPVLAGLITQAAAFLVLWWLVTPALAVAVTTGYVAGSIAILVGLGRRSFAPSETAERAVQAQKRKAVDLLRGQADVIMQGEMGHELGQLAAMDREARAAFATLDRADRLAGVGLTMLGTLVAGCVLLIADPLVRAGTLDPALGVLAFFVALALAETTLPLRRGVSEIGRLSDAASRVVQTQPDEASLGSDAGARNRHGLEVTALSYTRPGAAAPLFSDLSFTVARGETVALTGPSGRGKSTVLEVIAGLIPPTDGAVRVEGRALGEWSEATLRGCLTLLPQRSALIAGTVRDNLALAADRITDDEAWNALRAVALDETIAGKGGLAARLGEGGSGLSGGEARRLALARALLRRPSILLLDEPTEGLDEATAHQVLTGVRQALPEAAILTASHRTAETEWAHQTVALQSYIQKTE